MLKLFIFITVAIVVVSARRLPREEPYPNGDIVENGIHIVKDGVKKLERIATHLMNANNTESILNQAKSLANSIKESTDQWVENTSAKELRDIASNAIEGFKADNPELANAIKDTMGTLNKAAHVLITHLRLMADDQDLKDMSNTLIDGITASIVLVSEHSKGITDALKQALKFEPVKETANP